MRLGRFECLLASVLLSSVGWPRAASGGALTGSFSQIPLGTAIDLTVNGPLDWVHWGTYTEYASDRKAGVTPLISGWTSLGTDAKGIVYVYQFAGNFSGYTWFDGSPTTDVAYTDTGVWAYKAVNPNKPQDTVGSGFTFSAPADTKLRRLKVYVGAYNARGRFAASLSDGSAASYVNTSLANIGDGLSGVYTVTYAANSAGQTLTISYTLAAALGSDVPNVTLQGAALAYAADNNPPVVWLNEPADSGTYPAASDITLSAAALDTDVGGSIANVEFFEGTNRIAAAAAAPFTFIWTNVTPGNFTLTARATDDLGEMRLSSPVQVLVYANGGTLNVSSSVTPPAVVLTGSNDWTHWGLVTASSYDRRANLVPQISDFSSIGANAVQRLSDDSTLWTWTDGTPTVAANNSPTALFLLGQTNGFELSMRADTNSRTLRVYVGLSAARGKFQATLSDFSAPAYTDESLVNLYGRTRRCYVLTYAAASAGQLLKVKYSSRAAYDENFGHMSLHSTTLLFPNTPPLISVVPDQITATDYPLPPVPFAVSDGESLASNLVVTALSSNTNLIANSQLRLTGVGTNRFLEIAWATNQIGTSVITMTVQDQPGATASTSFLVTVLPANLAPVLAPITDQVVDEQTTLVLTNSATDANDPRQNGLTFSIVSGPTNATIDPVTGLFSWTPTEAQGPGTNIITVAVTDNGFPNRRDMKSFVAVVNEVNLAPSLAPVADRLVHRTYPLTFTTSAVDLDLPPQALTFALSSDAPSGAAINPTNGMFTWTPRLDQGPSTNRITVMVTDNGPPPLSDTNAFTIIVLETNRPPQFQPVPDLTVVEEQPLTVTNLVTDVDWPAQNLMFSLDTNAPAGASINPTNGVLTWTPTEYQGPSSNVIGVIVTDDGFPPLSTVNNLTVTVLESNRPPSLAPVPELLVNRGNLLLYTNLATDPDWPRQILTFRLNASAPAGAAVDPASGVFSWRPTLEQGPSTNLLTVTVRDNGAPSLAESRTFSVLVLETNRPPILAPVPDVTVYEGTLIAFTNHASDLDWPLQTLTYSFGGSVPAGATLNPATGNFTWTPSEDQGPATNVITVVVHDNGLPALSATQTFTVVVLESNRPPVLAPVPNFLVMKGHSLPYSNSATDSDLPAQTLVFWLGTNAPAGASVNPTNGLFDWTPGMDQGPSTNSITVMVTDSGSPPLTDSKSFTVIVLETNRAPVLASISDVTFPEGQLLTISNRATDVDWPAQTLLFSLDTSAPAGATINPSTGVFTWMPSEEQAPATNRITVVVTDDGDPPLSASQSFTAIVLESNRPPVLQPIANVTFFEGQLLVVTNSAADPDLPAQTLTFSLGTNAPAGAFINSSNGLISWTPTEFQGPGTNLITVVVTDDGSPPLNATRTFTATVLESNRPPAISPITDHSIYEGELLLVTNYASDPDWPAQNLTFSFETNAPAGATINATNGAFAWTPSEEQGPGTNVVKIIVTDNGSPPLSNRLSFTVTVLESNRPPVLAPVPDLMVMKGRGLSWTNSATDADWPPQSVTFSLGTNTPAGAVVNPTNGVFAWTPAMNQGPATNLITVIVSDNGPPPLSDSRTFTVIVLETNRPPILEPLQDVTVIEGKLLLITNRASDVDWPPQLLTYTLDTNAPAGAVINATNGILSWTPSEEQGPGTNLIRTIVTDNGDPPLSATQSFTVTVIESNRPPTLRPIADATVVEGDVLTFTNHASDPDWPSQNLAFSLGTNVPAGATINATNGIFTWTPSEEQGPGTNLITVIVADDGVPRLSATQTFAVIVLESNRPPVLAPLPDLFVLRGYSAIHAVSAADPDWPGQQLTFSLGAGAPAGASIDRDNGVFTWVIPADQPPGSNPVVVVVTDDGFPALSDSKTFSVVVVETNRPPVLQALLDVTIPEGELLVITNHASDPDFPVQTLTFSLDASAPAGAVINATNGILTWTPSEEQGPGTNSIAVIVSDNVLPSLTATQTFTVTVLETNAPPLLASIPESLVIAGQTLFITNHATDPDWPAQSLLFSLPAGAPAGAEINATNGLFKWTPTSAQAGTNSILIVVADSGSPPLQASQVLTVFVLSSNNPPVLAPIPNQVLHARTTLTYTNSATDPDFGQNLTFSLGANAPAGCLLTPDTGVLIWTPTDSEVGLFSLAVRVTDDGQPNLTSEQTFRVSVLPRPQLVVSVTNHICVVSWLAIPTKSYRVQKAEELGGNGWVDMSPDLQASGFVVTFVDPVSTNTSHFYRVVVLP